MRGIFRLAAAESLTVSLAQPAGAAEHGDMTSATARPASSDENARERAGGSDRQKRCKLDNGIERIVYIQFDNVHFRRDNPNVPSDLEQMPNLLSFLEDKGTLFTNHYTPLISHTAVDILTALTGVYGDKFGIPIGNSLRYFNPDGTTNGISSFAYWTDPVAAFWTDRDGHHPADDRPAGQDPPGTMGAIHPCRLRCRGILGGQHRVREYRPRRYDRVWRGIFGGKRGEERSDQGQCRFSRHRNSLRKEERAMCIRQTRSADG
jgi:hypothetical protein